MGIFDGDLSAVQRAVTAGAKLNVETANGHLPLTSAIGNSQWQIAGWLRSKGASIQKAGPHALLWGAEYGNPDIIRYVLRCGIKPTGLYSSLGESPLTACAGSSESDEIAEIADSGDEIEDESEETPQSYEETPRSRQRRLEALKLLLAAGLQPNQRDKNGQLPLQAAAERGREALVALLLDKGAAVNAINRRGFTPLFAATTFPATSQPHKKVRQLLFVKGADVNIGTPQNGLSPFHYAVREGREDLMKEFLSQKANVNAPLKNGRTPLIIAMIEARVGVARLLLSHNAQPQIKDKSGKTALDYETYGIGDTDAQTEIDLNDPQTREFFDEAMNGKVNAKFWADIKKRRAEIATLIRQKPAASA
jgi:uncharacterized protein